ncbi:MAG TPA: pirin family protein [Luteibaculaceae bacterium]|nr:pirin family protein [Luteibaculaceae bacterium]
MDKSIEKIITPRPKHWVGDGFYVHNFIPGSEGLDMRRMDPFIMLDYNAPHYFPPARSPRGVDVHPHRGFETVTIAYKGVIKHTDSSGGGGVIQQGDVQWMTAASGILHKEFHEENFTLQGGEFQMAQLWVNLPARYKMTSPGYQSIKNDQIVHVSIDGGSRVEVIAGEYQGNKGPAKTFSPVHLSNAHLSPNSTVNYSFPANWNTALLVIEGEVTLGEQTALQNQFVLMANRGEDFALSTPTGAIVLVLSGEPLNEPIAAHGPFVMNTRQEILEAIDDYNAGKFGHLD